MYYMYGEFTKNTVPVVTEIVTYRTIGEVILDQRCSRDFESAPAPLRTQDMHGGCGEKLCVWKLNIAVL